MIKKKLKALSMYSDPRILVLPMREFGDLVKKEVKSFVDARGVDVDKSRIESRLMNTHSTMVHLDTEKRIIQELFLEQKREFHKVETDTMMISSKQLSVKATAREHKIFVHEEKGDELEEIQTLIDKLEQRYKLLGDHVDALRANVSTMQSVLASMRAEWEVSRA